jgi:hypothetical protein
MFKVRCRDVWIREAIAEKLQREKMLINFGREYCLCENVGFLFVRDIIYNSDFIILTD